MEFFLPKGGKKTWIDFSKTRLEQRKTGTGKGEQNELDTASDVLHTRYIRKQNKPGGPVILYAHLELQGPVSF